VLWAPARRSGRFETFSTAGHFAIHVLGAEQRDLCDLFARDGLALASLPHDLSAEGVPILTECLARFECRRESVHDAGDHVLVIGRVIRAAMRSGPGLAFFGGGFHSVPDRGGE
jgi:flavin reductase (DIM6/NTAB) family NADH-FMN oxidoreductase RutF